MEDNKRYIISPDNGTQAIHAPTVCHNLQSRQPEIRSVAEREKLTTFTIKNNFKAIMIESNLIKQVHYSDSFQIMQNPLWPSTFED
jgi:hypothetical protein